MLEKRSGIKINKIKKHCRQSLGKKSFPRRMAGYQNATLRNTQPIGRRKQSKPEKVAVRKIVCRLGVEVCLLVSCFFKGKVHFYQGPRQHNQHNPSLLGRLKNSRPPENYPPSRREEVLYK